MHKSDQNNMKIGLLGGSFDPPHAGHLFISKDALKRFNLDRIWWVVAKQNTLKENKASDFNNRMKLCKKLLKKEPRILPLDIEKKIESNDTIDVLNLIKQNNHNKYLWIMGSDSFFTFDKWPEWQKILRLIKIIVYDRTNFLFKENKINPALKKYQTSFIEFQHAIPPTWTLVKIITPKYFFNRN